MDDIKINEPGPNFTDYKELLTEDDWNKFFEGKRFYFNDPLKVAMLRSMERLCDILEKKDKGDDDQ